MENPRAFLFLKANLQCVCTVRSIRYGTVLSDNSSNAELLKGK